MGLFSSSKSETRNEQTTNVKTVTRTEVEGGIGLTGRDAVELASVIVQGAVASRSLGQQTAPQQNSGFATPAAASESSPSTLGPILLLAIGGAVGLIFISRVRR